MVEDSGDRLLPVVIEREPAEGACPALPGSVEGDHVEPGRGDALPDGEELLDQRVEPAMQEHGSARPLANRGAPVGGQGGTAVRNVVAHDAAVRERRVEETSVATVARHLLRAARRGEELRDAEVARRVAESGLALRLGRERLEHRHAVALRLDLRSRAPHLFAVRVAERVRPVHLVVEERPTVKSLKADRKSGQLRIAFLLHGTRLPGLDLLV